ncbi:hypothetical protein MKHDV_01289 [Halodesulfovibrio sp. MK-HDV]|nr:hypothetical protein MKHDV_01289 [Halodesulfovibrio sp. MK-HDV]
MRRNIIFISLISLSAITIISDLHSTGGSLIASPFYYLPDNSIFTFWFSYIFKFHSISLVLLLLSALALLILRSIFDFLFHPNSPREVPFLLHFRFYTLIELEELIRKFLSQHHSKEYRESFWALDRYDPTFIEKTRRPYVISKRHNTLNSNVDSLNILYSFQQLLRTISPTRDENLISNVSSNICETIETELNIKYTLLETGNSQIESRTFPNKEVTISKSSYSLLIKNLFRLYPLLHDEIKVQKDNSRKEIWTLTMCYVEALGGTFFGILTCFLLIYALTRLILSPYHPV